MNISNSIRKLTQLFIILFLALSGGLVYWQVVVAQQVTSNTHNVRQCLPDSAPFRGRILDRNGVVLAESKLTNNGCGYQRFYYLNNYPSLAGLIGYYISPLFSSTGIEHQFDDYLNGVVGRTSLIIPSIRRFIVPLWETIFISPLMYICRVCLTSTLIRHRLPTTILFSRRIVARPSSPTPIAAQSWRC